MDTARDLHQKAKEAYWKAKDLPTSRALLEQGIAKAREEGDLSEEKGLNYDLASFCWPGWDEPGIAITENDIEAGERAAFENLRLAQELNKPDGPMAAAWFMVGAYHLQARRYGMALEAFENYGTFGAQMPANALLAGAYASLIFHLQGHAFDLEACCATIRDQGGENGEEFARQIRTAARIYGP